MKNWYEVLGVDPKATDREITQAYRLRARENHPDRGGSDELMQEVNSAYEVLSDPNLRAAFDENWEKIGRLQAFLEELDGGEYPDESVQPDLTRLRLTSKNAPFSEHVRAQHAAAIQKFSTDPTCALPEVKETVPDQSLLDFFSQSTINRCYELNDFPDVQIPPILDPFHFVEWAEEEKLPEIEIDPEVYNAPLDLKKAIEILTAFVEGEYYGPTLLAIKDRLDFQIQMLEMGPVRNQPGSLHVFKMVFAILEMVQHPEDRIHLFEVLNHITDYAAQTAVFTMSDFAPLFQSKFFRNFYLFALDGHSQVHGVDLGQDISGFSDSTTRSKDYLKDKTVRLLEAIETLSPGDPKIESAQNSRVIAKILYLHEKDRLSFQPEGDLAAQHRERALRLVDWGPALAAISSVVLNNLNLEIMIHWSLAAKHEPNPAIQMADEQLFTEMAFRMLLDLQTEEVDQALYLSMNLLPHVEARRYVHEDLGLKNKLKQFVFYRADFFPFYQPIAPYIMRHEKRYEFLMPLREMLYRLAWDVQQNEHSEEQEQIPLDHSPVRILYEAFYASLALWYEATFDFNLSRTETLRLAVMEKVLESEELDFFDIQDNIRPGEIFNDRDSLGWFKLHQYVLPEEPYAGKEKLDHAIELAARFDSIGKGFHELGIHGEGALNKSAETFESLNGFELDYSQGSVKFSFQAAKKGDATCVLDMDDVRELFSQNARGAYFSLEEVDPKLRFHPFQRMEFRPTRLLHTRFLNTLLTTDYLLKFFTTGVEVRGEYPYDFRPIDHLVRFLPEHLKGIIETFQAARGSQESCHRFWITATHVPVVADQSDGRILRYAMGDIKMTVQHHKMLRDFSGHLIDIPGSDGEGFGIYFLTQDKFKHFLWYRDTVEGPAIIFVGDELTPFFYEDGTVSQHRNLAPLSAPLYRALKEEKTDDGDRVVVTEDNIVLLCDVTRELAAGQNTAHRLSSEKIFAVDFTKYYDEFAEYFPYFKRLKEQSRVLAALQILNAQLGEVKKSIAKKEALLESLGEMPAELKSSRDKRYAKLKEILSESYQKRVFGYRKNVSHYNEILREFYRKVAHNHQISWLRVTQELDKQFAEVRSNRGYSKFGAATSAFTRGNWESLSELISDYHWDRDEPGHRAELREIFPSALGSQIQLAIEGKPSDLAWGVACSEAEANLESWRAQIRSELRTLKRLSDELEVLGIGCEGEDFDLTDSCLYVPSSIRYRESGKFYGLVYGGVRVAPNISFVKAGSPEGSQVVNPHSNANRGSFQQFSSAQIRGGGGGGWGSGGSGGGGGDGKEPPPPKPPKRPSKSYWIRKAQLPQEGGIRFIPPRKWNPSEGLKRTGDGYRDKFGNTWVEGPSRTAGEPFEWDVQLSEKGRNQLKNWLKDKNQTYLNVSLRGRVTHGKKPN